MESRTKKKKNGCRATFNGHKVAGCKITPLVWLSKRNKRNKLRFFYNFIPSVKFILPYNTHSWVCFFYCPHINRNIWCTNLQARHPKTTHISVSAWILCRIVCPSIFINSRNLALVVFSLYCLLSTSNKVIQSLRQFVHC